MTIIAIPMGIPGAGKSTLSKMFAEMGKFKTIRVSDIEVSSRRDISRIQLILKLLIELILSKKFVSDEKVKDNFTVENYLKALDLNNGSFNGAMELLITGKEFLNITLNSEKLKILKKEIEENIWMPSCYDILNNKIKEMLSESPENNIFYDIGARQYNEILRIKNTYPSFKTIILYIQSTPECVSMRWMNELSVSEIKSKDLGVCKRTNFYNELIKITKAKNEDEARQMLLNNLSLYENYKDFINNTLIDRINSINEFFNNHKELEKDTLKIINQDTYENYIKQINDLLDKLTKE